MKLNFLQLFIFIIPFVACKDDNNVIPEDSPTSPVIENPNAIEISNASFENGLEGWTRVDYANGSKTLLEVVDGEGVNNSKALKIQQLPVLLFSGQIQNNTGTHLAIFMVLSLKDGQL